jgi:hypothetical protein
MRPACRRAIPFSLRECSQWQLIYIKVDTAEVFVHSPAATGALANTSVIGGAEVRADNP